MRNEPVMRDERTVAVENASYRLAYTLLAFGVLLSVAYRGLVLEQSGWDLLGLVIVSSGVATFYQGVHKTLPARWLRTAALIAVAAGILAALLAFFFTS
jgi:hypothetical protein